jgi:hypothetical protein
MGGRLQVQVALVQRGKFVLKCLASNRTLGYCAERYLDTVVVVVYGFLAR